MQVEFVRFKAADDVELQGWLSNATGDTATLNIHGMSGGGREHAQFGFDEVTQIKVIARQK